MVQNKVSIDLNIFLKKIKDLNMFGLLMKNFIMGKELLNVL